LIGLDYKNNAFLFFLMYCLFFSERFDLKPDYSNWYNTAIATATIGFTGFTAIGFAAIVSIGSI